MKIVTTPNKVLRQKAEEIIFPLSKEMELTADRMMAHIHKSQEPNSKLRGGVGIAAPQIGLSKRMFYINIPQTDVDDGFELFLMNPVLIGESPTYSALEGGEGCLSVGEDEKHMDGLVHRRFKVIMKGYSYLDKKEITVTKTGYPAIVMQHEFDHLEGKLFFDRINRKDKWSKKDGEVLI